MLRETTVLLTLEPLSAIYARVAYRLIEQDYRRNTEAYTDSARAVGVLGARLHHEGFTGLSAWVCSYAYHIRQGVPTGRYKQRSIWRARWAALNRREGKPWARVPEE